MRIFLCCFLLLLLQLQSLCVNIYLIEIGEGFMKKYISYEEIKNNDELEVWTKNHLMSNLGGMPFYIEIKPGFQAHTSEILQRLENAGLSTVMKNTITRTRAFNKVFYQNLLDRPEIWEKCNRYMCGKMKHPYIDGVKLEAPTMGFIIMGNGEGIKTARSLQGSTGNPAPGTIRYDYALKDENGNIKPDMTANVMHCSDSAVNGVKEAYLSFFGCEKYGMKPDVEDVRYLISSKVEDVIKDTYKMITEKEAELEAKNQPVVKIQKEKGSRKVNGGDRKVPKKTRGAVAKAICEKDDLVK